MFAGRRASAWIEGLRTESDADSVLLAKAKGESGDGWLVLVPRLLDAFERSGDPLRRRVYALLGESPQDLGPHAARFADLLVPLLDGSDDHPYADMGLTVERFGTVAVPAVLRRLAEPSSKLRAQLLRILEQITNFQGSTDAFAAAFLAADLLSDADPAVATAALRLTARADTAGDDARLAFWESGFASAVPDVRQTAARLLATAAPATATPRLLPRIRQMLASPDDEDRSAGLSVLARLAVEGAPVTKEIVRLLDDPAEQTAVEAAAFLCQVPGLTTEDLEALGARLPDLARPVRAIVAANLVSRGAGGDPALAELRRAFEPPLEPPRQMELGAVVVLLVNNALQAGEEPRLAWALLESPAREARRAGLGALSMLVGTPFFSFASEKRPPSWARHVAAAWDPRAPEEDRVAVVGLLAALDAGDHPSSVLDEALADEAAAVRAAVFVVRDGARPSRIARERALRALGDKDAAVRRGALDVFGAATLVAAAAGEDPAAAVATLVGLSKDPDEDVRVSAIRHLVALGRRAADAAPALAELVRDARQTERTRSAALVALGEIGLGSGAALTAVLEATAERELEDRARSVLAKAGPETLRAIAADLEARDPGARRNAARTLAELVPAPESRRSARGCGCGAGDRDDWGSGRSPWDEPGWEPREDETTADLSSVAPALLRALRSEDAFVRRSTTRAVAGIRGPAAIPDVVTALRAALDDPDAGVRTGAARALGRFGATAAPAAPALVDALLDAPRAADASLREIGKPAAPALRAALSDPDRRDAVSAILHDLGEDAAVREALASDASPEARRAALEAVLQRPAATRDEVAWARGLLADDTARVRFLAALVVARSALDPSVLPILVRDAELGDWEFDDTPARRAVKGIGAAVVDAVLALADDPDAQVAARGERALDALGDAAVPALLVRLEPGREPAVRRAAARRLGSHASTPEVSARLRIALEDIDPGVRANAAIALAEIRPVGEQVSALIDGVECDDPDIQVRAIETLAKRHPEPEAIPALVNALTLREDPDRRPARARVPGMAADALAKIGPEAVPALVAELRREGGATVLAIRTLAAIGPDAKDAAPALVEVIAREEGPVDEAAAALGATGGATAAHAEALVGALDRSRQVDGRRPWSRSPVTLHHVLVALGKDAVPALVARLGRADRGRVKALRVLEAIGPAAADAIPAVEPLARKDGPLRLPAAATLAALGRHEGLLPTFTDALGGRGDAETDGLAGLRHLGADGAPAAARVLALAQDDRDNAYRPDLVETLAAFGVGALPSLFDALRAGNPGASTTAREALEEMLAQREPVAVALVLAAESEDEPIRAAARRALDEARPVDPEVLVVGRLKPGPVEQVLPLLAHESAAVRLRALRFVARGDEPPPAVLDAVLARAGDPDGAVRGALAEAAAGWKDAKSAAVLSRLASDEDPKVRAVARRALERRRKE